MVFPLPRTSKRSYGRERRVNEKEIERLMARYEPRLVRFFRFLLLRGNSGIMLCVLLGHGAEDLARNAATADAIAASAATTEIHIEKRATLFW